MAAYATPVGLVTFTPAEELAADLQAATEQRKFRVPVWSCDLRQELQERDLMVDYIRRCASNCAEAHAILKQVSPRDAH